MLYCVTMTQPPVAIRILIVDDDPDIRTIVAHVLRPRYEVVAASSGVEALERIDRYEPDLIIMDVMMPVLTGIETSRAIKKDARFADVPIIFLTARSDNDAVREAMRAGADFYLQKPLDSGELLRAVQQITEVRNVVARPKRFSIEELAHTGRPRPRRVTASTAAPEIAQSEAEQPAAGDQTAEPRTGTPNLSGRVRIMIVDDDVDVVNYVKSILREDYEAIGLCDSEQAPEKIMSYQPDILLLDIVMPKLNGFHLSHLIRLNKRLRGSKIIFVSSRTDHEAVAKAFSLGASDFLEKPFTPEQLRRKILGVTRQPDFVLAKKRLSYVEILRREGDL
jgi:DNA-binding response OmpR family regulator